MGRVPFQSFSNDIFSLDEANSVLTIEEDSTETLTFIFEPTGAGVFNETVQLHTNDPNNNVIEIDLQGVSVSEVGGEVCDAIWVWMIAFHLGGRFICANHVHLPSSQGLL